MRDNNWTLSQLFRCSVSTTRVPTAGRCAISASRATASVAGRGAAVPSGRGFAASVASTSSVAAAAGAAVSARRRGRSLVAGVRVAWDRVVAVVSLGERVLRVLAAQNLLRRASVRVVVAGLAAAVTSCCWFVAGTCITVCRCGVSFEGVEG